MLRDYFKRSRVATDYLCNRIGLRGVANLLGIERSIVYVGYIMR